MKIWIWIAVGIGLVSILSAVGWLANSGVDVEVVRAKQGPIRETISEQGTTRIPDVYEVRMPFSGELAGFELKEGDTISAGATVVQIGPRELENHVQEAQAAVERLTAALAENQNDGLEKTVRKQATRFVESMAATVEAAQTQIESSQEKLDFSETLLGRETQLLERQASNQENVDRARLNYVESQISFRQNNLIVKSIRAIDAATQLMPSMIDDYLTKKLLQHEVLAAQRREAQARLDQALLRQSQGNLQSPVEGTLLVKHTSGSSFLASGEPVFTVGDLKQLEVEVEILTQDAMRVQLGDVVELYGMSSTREGNAEPTKPWTGRVHQILPTGFKKLSSLGVEQQRVMLRVELPESVRTEMLESGVRVGYQIQVRIVIDAAESAILVPRTAVFRDAAGHWSVFKIVQGRARQTQVETGVLGDRNVQIISGVADDESVVVTPDQRLQDGTRVNSVELQ